MEEDPRSLSGRRKCRRKERKNKCREKCRDEGVKKKLRFEGRSLYIGISHVRSNGQEKERPKDATVQIEKTDDNWQVTRQRVSAPEAASSRASYDRFSFNHLHPSGSVLGECVPSGQQGMTWLQERSPSPFRIGKTLLRQMFSMKIPSS